MAKQKILIISDLQMPFHHKDALAFLKYIKKRYKPNIIINIGDTVDLYCLNMYGRDPDALSATSEIAKMKQGVQDLAKLFPKMEVLVGNHCARLKRAAVKAGIPTCFVQSCKEYMGAPKSWNFHEEEYQIDDILFTHGDECGAGGSTAAEKRAKAYGLNSVAGHLHTQANIVYIANRKSLLFGMQVGSLIDSDTVAFGYAKKNLRKAVLSVGYIEDGIPQILPMRLNKEGRWIGHL
jgi:predicted MPP superfamily phosphohydrolase